ARDYLDAAGAEVSLPASQRRAGRDAEIIDFGVARANLAGIEREGSNATAVSNVLKQSFKAEVAQLLRDKRYDSALELLCAASERHPEDPEIARSIELLRARLETRTLPPRASIGPMATAARTSRAPTVPAHADTVPARANTVPARANTVPARDAGHALANTGLPPALDAGVGEEDYPKLFKRATEAYMIRDFELAIQLFEKCHEQRPDDRRPLYNLNALRRRMRGE
ncbi:MAG TPA: hypothetical protein VFU02_19365, partial [Polyangiaceae bacterium]|nr:hypothetical protein [Polyangiaceae bacterium]